MIESIQRLNDLSTDDAVAALLACCGSTRWAREVANERPFRTPEDLIETADQVWSRVNGEDWVEAFRSHPRIGESKAARETGAEAQRWSEREQSGTASAVAETLDELARANRDYEQRFGHIFIVCATGKSAAEMLEILRTRMSNPPELELRVAAEEQRKIMQLRLAKLLSS